MTAPDNVPLRLVIHGGAGAINRRRLTAEREVAYREVLTQSLTAGYAVLSSGGSSIDAVIAAIVVLEDSPFFNAGKGSVFNHEGQNELEASIMEGATRLAGAVAGISRVRNPICAAHAIMLKSPHAMLIGPGAEKFAAAQGLEIVDPEYFYTSHRWEQLQKALANELVLRDHDADSSIPFANNDEKHGTVGAVALDRHGNLAAGTSTGGLTNKQQGRVGDSSIIGAGTYADNRSVAVSATGTGEVFIRAAAAYQTAAQVKLLQKPINEAADGTLKEVSSLGGDGGLIVLNAKGDFVMQFNTSGMFRGTIGNDGMAWTGIFPDE